MKIYTKTGDKGQTSLIGGTRVSKADLHLDTYGTADELNAYVGWLRAKELPQDEDAVLGMIQHKLFNLGAYLASEPETLHQTGNRWIEAEDVLFLEQTIDVWSENLPAMRGFILPAGNERVALAHVCRTVTRRLERKMVALQVDSEADRHCLQYVNRLSDLFFILARKIAQNDKCEVFLWEK